MKKCIDFISINGEDEIKEIKQNIEDGKFKFDKEGKYFIYFKINNSTTDLSYMFPNVEI